MALPSGYRRLKCLKSTGTQYLITSIIPSNDLRFELDCEITYETGWIMIAGAYESGSRFSWWANATKLYAYYGTASKNMTGASGRITLVADNNVWTDGTNTMTLTEETLAATKPIYICSVQNGGSYALASMTVYGGKAIKNGVLTNNYIPALRESDNKPGLYDDVTGEFLTNAGTGEFGYEEPTPSGDHRTMVDGVIWGIPAGRCMVDGVGYSIKKGRTLIDGVGYDVPFGTSVVAVAVNISGTGDTSGCFVTIAGTKYTAAATGLQVKTGDVITFTITGYMINGYATVTIDGVVAMNSTTSSPTSYEWTVPDGISEIAITLNYKSAGLSRYGVITVTTS